MPWIQSNSVSKVTMCSKNRESLTHPVSLIVAQNSSSSLIAISSASPTLLFTEASEGITKVLAFLIAYSHNVHFL